MDTTRVRWGGMNWDAGIDEYTPLRVTWMTHANLLCGPGTPVRALWGPNRLGGAEQEGSVYA